MRNTTMQQMKNTFLNKEVQIFPGDTNWKYGTVLDINTVGVTFLITKSKCGSYPVGSVRFIAFGNNLNFTLYEKQ